MGVSVDRGVGVSVDRDRVGVRSGGEERGEERGGGSVGIGWVEVRKLGIGRKIVGK